MIGLAGLIFFFALALELAAIGFIFSFEIVEVNWFSFAILHLFSSLLVAWSCSLVLPLQYQRDRIKVYLFFVLMLLALPFVGMLGFVVTLIIALHTPKKPSVITWQAHEQPELPSHPGDIQQSQFGISALTDILLSNDDVEQRLLAVSAVKNFSRKQALPLLQIALNDLADDVRLQAYALIEKIEAEITADISLAKQQLEANANAAKALEVAQLYWELCYLGIGEGNLLQHYLSSAETYAKHALELEQSLSGELLLGRVYLKLGQYQLAQSHFNKAQVAGALISQVAPYLAECAFHLNDYAELQNCLRLLPTQQGNELSQVKAFWLQEARSES